MNREFKYLDYVKKSNDINKINIDECYEKLNIAFLRSFTIEMIEPILKVEAYKKNIYSKLFFGKYNQYYQEIFNNESEFYKFNPDFCIIAIRLEELYPRIINNYLDEKDNLLEIEDYIISQYNNMIEQIKKNLECNILIHNFVIPYNNYTSLYDFQHIEGQVNFIRKLNLALVKMANKYTGVYIVDIEHISSLLGKLNIQDKRMWYISKNPYKYEFYVYLSNEYMKYISAINGLKKKCIILDLDNTLWGGIIGEDGIDGIKIGDSYPGNCYKDFQKQLLKLKNRGIILAICSKNNIEDVNEVFEKHPDMILKKDDFTCIRANWNDKYTNIKSISEELNIGMDSFVFIDDNPVECELIQHKIPEVTVINLSKNPIEYSDLICGLNYFETINLTEEDLKRTDIYKAQMNRNNLRDAVNNLDEYYKSLEIRVEIKQADDFAISRIAQLTQKTNQFNLTTKRYTEEHIKELCKNDKYKIYYIKVVDKFGDNGITGCCILNKIDSDSVYIDTLLLSCRVMGRNIEIAFISFICNSLKKNNIKNLIGEYIPTKKNKPVKDFFENLGFSESDNEKFLLNLNDNKIVCPNYIEII